MQNKNIFLIFLQLSLMILLLLLEKIKESTGYENLDSFHIWIVFLLIVVSILLYKHLCIQTVCLRALNNDLEDLVSKRTKELEQAAQIISRNVLHSRTDLNGKITDVSEAFCETSGYSREELIGQSHTILRDPKTDTKVYENLWKTIQSGRVWTGYLKNISKDGTAYVMNLHITPEIKNGEITSYLAIREDVTAKMDMQILNEELIKSEAHYRRLSDINRTLANTDVLTGVLNRRAIFEASKSFCAPGEHNAVMMIDIDDFKAVNDTYGHDSGDEVLKSVVKSCQKCLRDKDLFARLGGEEFVVVLLNSHINQAKEIATRILKSVESQRNSKEQIAVTVSIGITICEENLCCNFSQSLKAADKMLYKAKELGKNQYQC